MKKIIFAAFIVLSMVMVGAKAESGKTAEKAEKLNTLMSKELGLTFKTFSYLISNADTSFSIQKEIWDKNGFSKEILELEKQGYVVAIAFDIDTQRVPLVGWYMIPTKKAIPILKLAGNTTESYRYVYDGVKKRMKVFYETKDAAKKF